MTEPMSTKRLEELERDVSSYQAIARLRETCREIRRQREEIARIETQYIEAVNGRRQFRQSYREAREENARLKAEVADLNLYIDHRWGSSEPQWHGEPPLVGWEKKGKP